MFLGFVPAAVRLRALSAAGRSTSRAWLRRLALCLILLWPAIGSAQPGSVVSWGTYFGGQLSGKAADQEYMAVTAGGYHSLALTADGSIVAWGENINGQCNAPRGGKFTAIAAGLYHSLALRADGTVVAWGDNTRGQCNAPTGRFLAIAAGNWHSLAVRDDGTLVAWGWNEHGQCKAPPGKDFVDVAGGYYHSLALRADRSIVAWGSNGDGQCNVPPGDDFLQIAAGSLHSLAVRHDGTIVAWGRNSEGQCNVPLGKDFAAVAAGALHSLALTQDGRIMAWGTNNYTQCDAPTGDKFAAIAAGNFHSLAIHDPRRVTRAPRPRQPEAPAAQVAQPEPMLMSDKIVPYGEQTVAAQTRSVYPPIAASEPDLSTDRRGSLRDSRTTATTESPEYITPITRSPSDGGRGTSQPQVREIPAPAVTEAATSEPNATNALAAAPRAEQPQPSTDTERKVVIPPAAEVEHRPEPKPVRPPVEQPREPNDQTAAPQAETAAPPVAAEAPVGSTPNQAASPRQTARSVEQPSASEERTRVPQIRLTLPPVMPERPRTSGQPTRPEAAADTPPTENKPGSIEEAAAAPSAAPAKDSATQTSTSTALEEQASTPAPVKRDIDLSLTDFFRESIAADKYIGVDVNAAPVYHFKASSPTRHFCTIDENEKYDLIDNQRDTWKYQGIAFFAYPPGKQPKGSLPVYRFWSRALDRHYYTMSDDERRMLVTRFSDTWTYQGIAWYAPPVKPKEKN